ncbi:MAG: tetratricopeptide repeat protein [Chitinophagaceae bacterium]|nr:MAG: tetratricopeptide repeat protein [Chitinophagaceae bacterium]
MKYTIVLSILIGVHSVSLAQQTKFINDPQNNFKQAKDYYQKEQYSLAYPILKDLQLRQRDAERTSQALDYQEVRYYTTSCALRQNEEAAVIQAQDFIAMEDNSARVQMMSFNLAEYHYRKQDYKTAIDLYEKVSLDNLSNDEIADMKFHLGYSYFTDKQYSKARPMFDAIRQMPKDKNYLDANYYYGFLSFIDKKYNDALTAFRVVENDKEYSNVVPYYIASIYYAQNQKEKALEYVEKRLKSGGVVYDTELRHLLGHAYFEKGQFDKALPYLEAFAKKTEKLSREDLYELSYSYYKASNWNKAIEGFKQLGGKEDSLAQHSMYLLADSYLKTNQKANARNAFLVCAANSSNTKQKEISMFNYAKLSYELGFQDVSLTEFQKFLDAYANSEYAPEARELLVNVLANTNNYKDALTMIEAMPAGSQNAKRQYAKILYGRATELANDGMLAQANDLLTKAEADANNGQYLPFIKFWKGEIAYRQNRIDDAIRYYFDYLKSAAVNGEVNPTNAKYNLGYAFLKKENYPQAQGFFTQIASVPKINSTQLEQDAYIRSADCYYMNKEYSKALSMYNKVLEFSWPGSDYATFQKGMIAGAGSTTSKEKITLMTSIARKYPTSPLIADANMEIANHYMVNEQYPEAIPFLKNVVNDPNPSLKPKAMLRLGIVYYNQDNSDAALEQYTTLLKQYPNSPEADAALENARSIYIEQGKTNEYVGFARSMGKSISGTQEDQLAYQEAEVQFNNGNFPQAAKRFEEYLAKFPEGKFSLEALYYKSEIYFNQKDWAKAAAGYEILGDRAPHKFGEKSLLSAARLNFFDLKNYEKAEKYFSRLKDFATTQDNKLEAMRGLLRSQYQLSKWSEAVDNAKELLNQKGIGTDDKVLANMAIARSYKNNNQCEQAITQYRAIIGLSKSAYSAEARYEIAHCFYIQNKYNDAEKAAFDVINKAGSYEEWVTRAYVLLGDVYMKTKDYFNAKATYQSVIDNAKIETLRQEAVKKLAEATEEEKKNSKLQ